ncbi:MAG: deoxyribodipyrimidine photo-lyase [Xanthomonadaceae bacterium]|nr:deoxyribodipyrimidine photo-lyase [Xanthomonadaceae bacterium]
MSTAIVCFRRDLRLEDNPALDAALRAHERIACVYIHAPEEQAPWAPGAASRWWLHHSLVALDGQLRRRGGALTLLRGPTLAALKCAIDACGAQAVYWNRLYEPAILARDAAIKRELRDRGLDVRSFNANLLCEPCQAQTGQGGPYKVFTPFWRNVRAQLVPSPPIPAPARIDAARLETGVALESLRLLPRLPWDAGFHDVWQPGEAGAQSRLRRFLDDCIDSYRTGRDRPDRDDTSMLSPHLHFGEIGPRQIFWRIHERAHDTAAREAGEHYVRELGWREFSHHLLYHFPQTPQSNLNPQFDRFPWAPENGQAIRRWQRGSTGIPIVDAGMRQLWSTGWMHNRVRMIVASFLTKNLRQHWRIGARWFWDTLVDADLANNTQGWQWTAGCGADAAPYFRVFNPVTQGERFDPDGTYVRRWVPELRSAPAALIQQPWRDESLLRATGYPAPIVDLRQSREAALAAYRKSRDG